MRLSDLDDLEPDKMTAEQKAALEVRETVLAESMRHGYTRKSSEEKGLILNSLCSSCSHAMITRRQNKMDVNVYCNILRHTIPSDIEACSHYAKPETNMRNNIFLMIEDVMKAGTLIDVNKDREFERRGYL